MKKEVVLCVSSHMYLNLTLCREEECKFKSQLMLFVVYLTVPSVAEIYSTGR
jgi:hypothetical protein